MDIIQQIRQRAAETGGTVIFPEGEDPRVVAAAAFLVENDICSVTLVGEPGGGPEPFSRVRLSDTPDGDLILHLLERRRGDGLSMEDARTQLRDPLCLAACMVGTGRADVCVAGAVHATSDVLRSALRYVGMRKGVGLVSSSFLMGLRDGPVVTYADCGVVPYPDAEQLAAIAIESARTHRLLTGTDPKVAMLSFSTMGSASHDRVDLVREAVEIVRRNAPGLAVDGELQFDAAFVPEVGKRKAPDSEVAGGANVFIFPNLDAGNIAYKITERIGRATATGPLLQGLDRPVMDLSRGCGTEDIVNAACAGIILGKPASG